MLDDPSDDALRAARAALANRLQSPEAARAQAMALVADETASDRARYVALWAQALAERELNELGPAEEHLAQAVALAEAAGDDLTAAQVISSLVYVIAARGRLVEALDLAATVRDRLPVADRGDLEMRRALVLEQLGRRDEALDAYSDALAVAARSSDRVLEAQARSNRSFLLAFCGRSAEALEDAETAERLAASVDHWYLAAAAAHNHGFISGLRGDVVTALDSFARADAMYGRVGHPGRSAGVLASDRCEVLLAAGLHAEARRSAELAVASLDAIDDVNDLAEARLLLARACLAGDDPDAARLEATAAQEQFVAAGRRGWAASAQFVAFQAAAQRDDSGPDLLVDAEVVAAELEMLGWTAEAAAVRVGAAEAAVIGGHPERARELLRLAARARTRGRVDRRANAWLATALLREVDGDRGGAKRACRAGLRVVEEHQLTFGATDLRVGAATHAARLAALGLSLAVEDGRPREVLGWAERVRANALAVPSARPPADSELTGALAELRRLRSELDATRRGGAIDRELVDAVRRHEELVRDLARLSVGPGGRLGDVDAAALAARVDRRVFVEYVEVGGMLSAVVVSAGRFRLHRLAPAAEVASAIDAASFALGRLARSNTSEASAEASLASLADAASRLDDLLLPPAMRGDESVIVVPTGVLHGVPWASLPSLRGRSITLAVSARRWVRRPDEPPRPGPVAVIAGPGLWSSSAEVDAVRSSGVETLILDDAAATVAAALEMLDSASTVHLACHGNFRADSPMFSSLVMADGPMTVYDLERLASPPQLVVLPACNAGVRAVSAGDEVIGTASALLGSGVGTVVAPITVVNDEATTELMRCLHRELMVGRDAAAALGEVQRTLDGASPSLAAAAASFVCLV